MCLIAFSFQYPFDYHLIVAANRDEFYSRKTESAKFWDEDPEIWGGKDLEGGGTWMGFRKDGRFAFLTNYRNLHIPPVSNPISRGQLVREYLTSSLSPENFVQSKKENSDSYEGFNLVVGDEATAMYWNNRLERKEFLLPGVYALSNGSLDEDWFKTKWLKSEFEQKLNDDKMNQPEEFFSLLKNTTQADDSALPNTGIGLEKERALSSVFIQLPGYGTRSSTFVALKKSGNSRQMEVSQAEEIVWVP